jgi:glucose-6-phosphate isomerase
MEISYSWASHNTLDFWQIRFIDNTDPAGIDHQIAQLGPELASTLVIVISKVFI